MSAVIQREPIVPAGKERAYDHWHYSPALRVGDILYVSGHVGRAPDGSVPADPTTQFRYAFENIATTLAAAGATWRRGGEMTTYRVGGRPPVFAFFAAARDASAAEPSPAWTAVGVTDLAADALVEIKATAHLGG